MTERDLVTRLESLWQAYGYGIALEAAAEIKRLREALQKCEGQEAAERR
jgi:hypothetical protein